MKVTTRVVSKLKPTDELRCTICGEWKKPEGNFRKHKPRPVNGEPERYNVWCEDCQQIKRNMAKGKPEIPTTTGRTMPDTPTADALRKEVARLRGQAVPRTMKLKSAGHTTKRRSQRAVDPQRAEARALRAKAATIERKLDELDPSGWVYLVAEEWDFQASATLLDLESVKVGKSSDEGKYRLAGLQTGNRRKLLVLANYWCKDRHAEEARLHAKFHSQNNGVGEWFRPTAALLSGFGLDSTRKEVQAA